MSTKEEKKTILTNGLKEEKKGVNKRVAYILSKKQNDNIDGLILEFIIERRQQIDHSINILKNK